MKYTHTNSQTGTVLTILAALFGFFLADTVLLIWRAPSLLQASHLSGFISLLASGLILYFAVGVYLLFFLVLLRLLSRLFRMRFASSSLAIITLFFGPLFMVVQAKIQAMILGPYISLKSKLFYVPTGITLAILVVALILVYFASARLSRVPIVLRRAFGWPWLTVTAFGAFVVLTFYYGMEINLLGVFSQEEQRASENQHLPGHQMAVNPDRPNFLVLMVEAFRGDKFNSENAPFIWKLSQEHIYFENHYVVSSATRPSVTSFFTSLYPAQHGCYNVLPSQLQNKGEDSGPLTVKVAESIESLPKILQKYGYRTIMLTSNRLTADSAFGFEYVFHRFDAADPYYFPFPFFGPFIGFHFLKRNLEGWRILKVLTLSPEHSTTYFDASRINKAVKRELARKDERPFFIYVHYIEPHSPYHYHPYKPIQLNLYLAGQLDNILSAYTAEIKAVDRAIADLFRYMEDTDFLDNTYVLITSDHGEEFYDHRNWGHGKSLYPEVIRVPAVLVLPRGQKRGRRIEALVENIDFTPTFAELAHVPSPEFWEGRSLAPDFVAEEVSTDGTMLAGKHRMAFSQFNDGIVSWASAIRDDWQVIFKGREEEREIMLFNLADDPLAQQNLYGQALKVEVELVSLLEENLARLETTAALYRGKEKAIDAQHLKQLRSLGYLR